MKRLFLSLVGVVAVGALSNCGYPGSALNGSWTMPSSTVGNLTQQVVFTFDPDSLTVTGTCTSGAVSLKAKATVTVAYTDTTFTTTSEAKNAVSQNGVNCSVSLAAGTMSYSVKGDVMTLTDSKGVSGTLTRTTTPASSGSNT